MLIQANPTEFDEVLLDRLTWLDEANLAAVLAHRADVLDPPWPRRLEDLTRRLSGPDSIALALRTLNRPEFQVLRAIRIVAALSGESEIDVDLGEVADLLGTAVAELTPMVDGLADRVLAWPDAGGRVRMPPSQAVIGVDFAGLGPSIAEYLPQQTATRLTAMGAALGVSTDGRKARIVEQLLEFFREPGLVADLAAGAPAGVAELLADFVWNGAERELFLYDEDFPYHARRGGPVSPAKWAVQHGLLWRNNGDTATMPLEIGLALRGPDYRLPFTPHRPEPAVDPVPAERVTAETATAALRIVDRLGVLLEHAAAAPIPLLQNGRVGTRALKSLAKETGSTMKETRLAVELAIRLLLLAEPEPEPEPEGRRRPWMLEPDTPGVLVPSARFAVWRAGDAARRLRSVIGVWWTLPISPLADEKLVRSALRDESGTAITDIRQLTMRLLTELPDGTGYRGETSLIEIAAWYAPTVSPELIGPLVSATLLEAAMLGVAGSGSAGALARVLVAGTASPGRPIAPEDPVLVRASDQLVAGARTTALFGADLTAVVTGPPDTELAGLLDRVADRETHGAASTWRFTPKSVRAALDNGGTPTALLERLRAIAGKPLPQPLEYLINDVGRRHGEVGVLDAGCVIVGVEPGLVAEIAAHRKLTALNLRSVAPTVVISGGTAEDTIAALRAAGYAPVRRDSDGAVQLRPATERPAPTVPDEPNRAKPAPPVDPGEHAARLLRTPARSTGHAMARGAISDLLSRTMRDRPTGAWMHLAWQLESGQPTKVTYLEPDGTRRDLLVSHAEVHGDAIDVWCAETASYRLLDLTKLTPPRY